MIQYHDDKRTITVTCPLCGMARDEMHGRQLATHIRYECEEKP